MKHKPLFNKDILNRSASEIMTTGGDHRITLQESSGLNSYGSIPYPKYTISYSSCTSSNISPQAYSYIEAYLHKIRLANVGFDVDFFENEFNKMRSSLSNFYELDQGTDVVFGASGTDVELIVILMAAAMNCKGVRNIILDSNEVGSGIDQVAEGRYFSSLTASGDSRMKGDKILGLEAINIAISNIPIRTHSGKVRDGYEVYRDIQKEVEHSFTENLRPIVHLIHRSKTGVLSPPINLFHKLVEQYGDNVEWVVDACQGRISIRSVNEYLALGASVMITGSKFFSGPPFSGAILVPEKISRKRLEKLTLPVEFSDFFTPFEFPGTWADAVSKLNRTVNLGLLLRWKAALYEMNRIFQIHNNRLNEIMNLIRGPIRDTLDEVQFIEMVDPDSEDRILKHRSGFSPFESESIFSFKIRHRNGSFLNYSECKDVYNALYVDLEKMFGVNDRVLKIPVLIGQPVKVGKNENGNVEACLRLAISSTLISDISRLDDEIIKMKVESDLNLIFSKIEFILENLQQIKFYTRELVE